MFPIGAISARADCIPGGRPVKTKKLPFLEYLVPEIICHGLIRTDPVFEELKVAPEKKTIHDLTRVPLPISRNP